MTMSSRLFRFACKKSELRLDITLQCGQSFRWREVNPGQWRGMIGNRVWTLSQDDTHIVCIQHPLEQDSSTRQEEKIKRTNNSGNKSRSCHKTRKTSERENNTEALLSTEKIEALMNDYFQLDVSLEKMYALWSKADQNFAYVSPQFPGVRMLNQDPVENVFSFICSSNNNIQRITMLVDRLCKLYGSPVATVDGTTWNSFPRVTSLAKSGVEETLREHGFGYRAKFISKSAQMILEKGGEEWLFSLRKLPYEECHAQLMTLNGIGAKVSDCICLMSMGHLGAIPVDTHVFQIAVRDYLPHLRSCKTVTDKVYKEIANHFRQIFGEYAGWAHSVLFSADLKKFDSLKNDESEEQNQKKKKKKK
ncbi:N-glycosylase/DNA lyase-like [Penaeus monodon]|uniref:N-glycosylase/DNA lyase-like n=1 Tax=Penaeus monodon TaxID=6687 RepID=UPI0018A7526A|nr:N-glycosylase/DNA lyase-like [Penaeus monodon]